MGCDTYAVYVGGIVAGKGMSLDYAMMLVKAIFNEFWNDTDVSVSIRKEAQDA